VSAPSVDHGRTPVLVDDIASTGHTLQAAITQLRAFGRPDPVCIVTHAVFADDAYDRLLAAGAARVVSTDTIPHVSNAIPVGALIADTADACFGPDDEAEAWFDAGEPTP
jgi:ribose-phosphate pyrophosphokinase